ncbi:MAG TPA: hypothetical protein VJY39_09650 [Acidisphaera sp.]|nr:hypothetical protein [Acidisphaera sp.]
MRTAALVAIALLALPSVASAQGVVSAREGNIWNGTAHEPSALSVHSAERAAGVAEPPAQAQQQTRTVEQLDCQLTGQAAH